MEYNDFLYHIRHTSQSEKGNKSENGLWIIGDCGDRVDCSADIVWPIPLAQWIIDLGITGPTITHEQAFTIVYTKASTAECLDGWYFTEVE